MSSDLATRSIDGSDPRFFQLLAIREFSDAKRRYERYSSTTEYPVSAQEALAAGELPMDEG